MVPIVILFLCLIIRLLFISNHLEGWDDVDFALSLHNYDLASYQPHFPGYFLYVMFCRVFFVFVNSETLALTLPNVVFGSLIVIPLYGIAIRMFSKNVAVVAAILYTINPLCWLYSEGHLPDISALFFVLLSIQLIYLSIKSGVNSFRNVILSGFVLGVAFGFKPSYFPFIVTWGLLLLKFAKHLTTNQNREQLDSKKCRQIIYYSVGALIIGIGIWLVPMIKLTGLNNLINEGYKFTSGHFSDWGGSIKTESNLFGRFHGLYWTIFVNGLGFWWYSSQIIRLLPTLICGGLLMLYIYEFIRSKQLQGFSKIDLFFLLSFVAPYLIWMFFFQNLSNSRHALPLIPIILILISATIIHLKQKTEIKICITSILIVSLTIISCRLLVVYKTELPPQLQLINYVKQNFNTNTTRLYCWDTKRLFDYYEPTWDVRRVRNITDLDYDLKSSLTNPKVILCTSKIEGLERDNLNLDFIKDFQGDRFISNRYANLNLYQILAGRN